MYVEFMKIFSLADTSEQMAVRFISAYWAQKTFDSCFLDMIYVAFIKNFLVSDSSALMAVRLISALSPKTFDSYFLDMMYVVFMKNFLLAASSWGQKRLIPTF